jgi:hypothetical protein
MRKLLVVRFLSRHMDPCVPHALIPLLALMLEATVLSRIHLGVAARTFTSVAGLALVYQTNKHAKKLIKKQRSDDVGPTSGFVRLFGWIGLGSVVSMALVIAAAVRSVPCV